MDWICSSNSPAELGIVARLCKAARFSNDGNSKNPINRHGSIACNRVTTLALQAELGSDLEPLR